MSGGCSLTANAAGLQALLPTSSGSEDASGEQNERFDWWRRMVSDALAGRNAQRRGNLRSLAHSALMHSAVWLLRSLLAKHCSRPAPSRLPALRSLSSGVAETQMHEKRNASQPRACKKHVAQRQSAAVVLQRGMLKRIALAHGQHQHRWGPSLRKVWLTRGTDKMLPA